MNVFYFQKHFDNAQFESHREDGLCKLRSDAVPMVFETLPSVTDSKISKQGIGIIHQLCHHLSKFNTGIPVGKNELDYKYRNSYTSVSSECRFCCIMFVNM